MATVFLAMRHGFGGFSKLVVVKRLRPDALEGDGLAMFHDEARISARLNHPNIVQTHEVGFDGEHYRLEMEYLDGQPLHRIVTRARKANRAIPFRLSATIVRDVLAGLHYAHELRDFDGTPLNVVHRDVSPHNIFITYNGQVKVVDFGIAKAAGRAAMTQLGTVKGKLRYMAPEQATGKGNVDRRADVFAAGVVLWQLLTGRAYWDDVDQMTIITRLADGDLPPSPRAIRPDVPRELDAICARALSLYPDDRYATAREMSDALEPHAAKGGSRAIGQLAEELFPDTRRAVREAIEAAAARPRTTSSAPPENLTKILQSATSLSLPAIQLPQQPPPSPPPPAPPEARQLPAQQPSAPLDLGLLLTITAIVAIMCIGFAVYVTLARSQQATSTTVTSPAKGRMKIVHTPDAGARR